jgi:hypothetical protein
MKIEKPSPYSVFERLGRPCRHPAINTVLVPK